MIDLTNHENKAILFSTIPSNAILLATAPLILSMTHLLATLIGLLIIIPQINFQKLHQKKSNKIRTIGIILCIGSMAILTILAHHYYSGNTTHRCCIIQHGEKTHCWNTTRSCSLNTLYTSENNTSPQFYAEHPPQTYSPSPTHPSSPKP